ncbi:hypothetical protein JKF63_06118 [Porcisia hertigi]|uniref:Peroxisomal membrane protein PEX16 n=1 Tax=Porcisia hertigi TaxID=2761500 RepID=A0A836IGK4_9TRYP|nr:hypothetical protein JKF63_06118 [Porcisia hertigi]
MTATTPSSVTVERSGGREGLPLSKLLDPLRWYFRWVRANPESASSLEQFSRTLTMLWSDPTNLITSEACFSVVKLHTFSNLAIITSGGRRTSKTELLTFVLQGIQEVQCLVELILRKYASHRRVWNSILLLESVKCVLKLCVHRQLFLVPWLWESIKLSLRRALRHLTGLTPRRRVCSNGGGKNGVSSGSGGSRVNNFAACGTSAVASLVGNYGDSATQQDYGAVSTGLRGDVVGPHNTRLVIPRVASDRRHEHRHVCRAVARSATEDRVSFLENEVMDEEEVERESIRFTWIDVLGIVLDMYLLLRPLLLAGMARHAFLARPDEITSSIAMLPPTVSKKERVAAATVAAKEEKEEEGGGTPIKMPARLDPLAALHKAMAATPQQTLMESWRVWAGVAGCDLLVAVLARLVRNNRVPVVYIKDSPESDESSALGASLEGGEAATFQGDGPAAVGGFIDDTTIVARAPDSRAICPTMEPPVVSRDRLRVQHALRNAFHNVIRDPFFTVVLKQLINQHFLRGFINRIPLLGACISFYVSHFVLMQHYSFLYTLGQ